ncbi:peptide-binding protein [Echinicola strongylocentroti]|uniref:Peptide-binding protein n=1 Tax=Echinicola strongylocentroti TaxID=1795355 RepID=A0A2Z4IK93_9BACT|nr:aspartyl protease family protein [Echinicola strongylocentroti]AWW30966.1 peptide-binding protein [Echinicola strongylocentroti]
MTLTKPILLFCTAIILSSTMLWGQVPGFYMKDDQKRVNIPFLNYNNLIIVPLSINDGPELNFLLDTGVKSNILFSKSIGDAIGLYYTRTLNLMGADGKTVLTALVSPNNHFDMGPVEGRVQPILVLEEDFLELERVIGVPIHGIIGYEFFKFNPVKVNYDTDFLTFYRRDRLKWRPFGYRKIALSFDNYKPYVQSTVDQIEGQVIQGKLLIDTGANHGLLLNRETSSEITLPPKHIETDLGRSLGGDLYGFAGRVKKYALGNLKFRKVITSYPDETEFSSIIIESGRLGSLGSDILARMTLIIDYPRERMLYKKGGEFHKPFEYDMSGLKVRLTSLEERRYYVSSVQEESPASRNNFKPGDEILSINLLPIEYWDLSGINDLLRSEPGREIIFTIRRNINGIMMELEKEIILKKQL